MGLGRHRPRPRFGRHWSRLGRSRICVRLPLLRLPVLHIVLQTVLPAVLQIVLRVQALLRLRLRTVVSPTLLGPRSTCCSPLLAKAAATPHRTHSSAEAPHPNAGLSFLLWSARARLFFMKGTDFGSD